nr:hypothetical protein [Massilistercora timonensis]
MFEKVKLFGKNLLLSMCQNMHSKNEREFLAECFFAYMTSKNPRQAENIWRGVRRNHGEIAMPIFLSATPDIDKKIQEIKDDELRIFMKDQGCSDGEIKVAIRNIHLRDEISQLENILCEQEEIFDKEYIQGAGREKVL